MAENGLDEARKIELLRRDIALEIEARKHDFALNQVNAKGVLDFAQGAIRSIILVNGGAIVALLTFLGNNKLSPEQTSALGGSLVAFSWGVGCGTVSAALAYLAQLELTYGKATTRGESRASLALRGLGILLGGAAIANFLFGVSVAGDAFT